MKFNRKKYTLIVIFWLVYWFSRTALRRWNQTIPLWYDPWLYKSLFLEYYQLWWIRDISQLPIWIKQMYPPLLGMWWAAGLHLLWWRKEWFLTWWRALISIVPVIWVIWYLWKRNKVVVLIVWWLFVLSFTQYQVFWRNYQKQTIAVMLAFVIGMLWEKEKYIYSIPLMIGIYTMHETTWVWIWIISILYFVILVYKRKFVQAKELWFTLIWSVAWSVALLLPFWHDKIHPLLAPLFWSIWQWPILDGYQWWGTFLTIRDYWWTARYIIVGWLVGTIHLIRHKKFLFLITATILTVIWIMSGGIFYQRMIWYADICLLATTSVWLWDTRRYRWSKLITFILLWLSGLYLLVYWYRMSTPIIENTEFDSIKKINTVITTGSIIVVPWIWYSPWIKWRTKAEILAPGMFDMNRRWVLSDKRETHWINEDITWKCIQLISDYPELRSNWAYLWIGSKQYQQPISWACFELIYQWSSPDHRLYRINTNFTIK